jgi:hypothetical protein
LPPDRPRFSWAVGSERSHLAIADCGLRIAAPESQYA